MAERLTQRAGTGTLSRAGLALTTTGAVAQAGGLALDAVRHVQDPGSASREALLSGNAAHVLLFGGMAAVLVGVTMLLVGPRLRGRSLGLQLALPITMALLVALGTFGAARAGLAEPHGHDDDGGPSQRATPTPSTLHTEAAPHGHQ